MVFSSNIFPECNPPKKYLDLIHEIYKVAKSIGIKKLAIVGGFVRDTLIQNIRSSRQSLPDIDLVIEGSVSELVKELYVQLGDKRLSKSKIYSAYDTAEIKLDGILIDLAAAREEIYKAPGENPYVSSSRLEADLKRRDFSANAIALDISSGKIIDLFQGRIAIQSKLLEFLHDQSVADDPTRIIRCARYAARLNFKITKKSLDQVKSTLKEWPWEWKNGDPPNLAQPALSTRLKLEINLLLNHEPWSKALTYLQSWGGLILFSQDIQSDKDLKRRIKWALRLKIDPLTALISGTENSIKIAERLQLLKTEQLIIKQSLDIKKHFEHIKMRADYLNWSAHEWCTQIESRGWRNDSIALSICLKIPCWKSLVRWLEIWRKVKSPITANELLKKGWLPGPEIGQELRRLRELELKKI